jgi:hypothetical protein
MHSDPGSEREHESQADHAGRYELAKHLLLQAHAAGRGPSPRGRRPTAQKAQRSKRRKRAGVAIDDDDELGMPEHHAEPDQPLSVGFRDPTPDGGDDHGEGGEERSRHDRLARVQHFAEELSEQVATPPAEEASATPAAPTADAARAVRHFVQLSVDVVAHWQPGDRVALRLQREKLQLFEGTRQLGCIDQGGLARVAEHLRTASHAVAGGASPALNQMLPLLLLQLQLRRTPRQTEQAIGRLKVALRQP